MADDANTGTRLMSERFTTRLRIRYSECDAQGVVFNGWYLFYYDVALTELMRQAVGDYGDMVAAGADLVVAEANLRYLAGARFDEQLDIDMPIAKLGTTSMTIRPVFRVGDRVVVEGEVRHVFIEPSGNTKKAMPDDVRAGLEPFLIEAVGARE